MNEHALHTWDVEVVLDPNATVPVDAAIVVIDNLDLIVRFGGRPTGEEHDVNVHTTNPARDFTLTLGADAVSLSPARDLVPEPAASRPRALRRRVRPARVRASRPRPHVAGAR